MSNLSGALTYTVYQYRLSELPLTSHIPQLCIMKITGSSVMMIFKDSTLSAVLSGLVCPYESLAPGQHTLLKICHMQDGSDGARVIW